ncbi:conserved hypothetical protein [Candidatus Desulfarcum epimagneticum]|uniref:Peptidase A2 domain-containing protein n=1 Tax=uncultured Desulfobacteraceae bacterium TaxID=218296 RepID=A0A484HG42_9BACT|nr:conserved hypothetical protein [uncultured Desulfobacteraceae bacterium]
MRCRQCGATRPNGARFCPECGAAFDGKRKKTFGIWAALIFFFAGLALGGTALFFHADQKIQTFSKTLTRLAQRAAEMERTLETRPPKPQRKTAPGPVESGIQLFSGRVTVRDPDGETAGEILGAAAGGSWTALPARACVGGDDWRFYDRMGRFFEIEGGIWRPGDRIGLWRISRKPAPNEYSLAVFDENRPLFWQSHEPGAPKEPAQVFPDRPRGIFRPCLIPENMDEPGVFIQGKNVVGWTFGALLDSGRLLSADVEQAMDAYVTVDGFYDATFAFSRERRFSKALAMGEDASIPDRLAAFSEGFLLEPKLSRPNTPTRLLPENILKRMRALADAGLKQDLHASIADALDERALARALDPGLFERAVRAVSKAYGYDRAAAVAEYVRAGAARGPGDEKRAAIERAYGRLRRAHIRSKIAGGDIEEGWEIFDRAKPLFQNDPHLHLLGVELALADQNWERALGLLSNMPARPPEMEDRIRLIEQRIAKARGEEGRITALFEPGSAAIPAAALINGAWNQDFIIDTGASVTVIPPAAARALGIRIGPGTPRREVSTAGGIRRAPEVFLSSIEMSGWVETDVAALVMDIPGMEGAGLLGLNYLNRFDMDIDAQKGVLSLTPR